MALLYSGVGGDLRITETANALVHVLLVDLTDLFGCGCCVDLGDQAGRGSSTDKVSRVDLDDAMTAPAEGVAPAVNDPATSNVTVAIARRALRRQESDLLRITGAPSSFSLMSPEWMAMDARNSIAISRTGLIAALFAGLINSVGATGVNLSVTNIYSAMFQLHLTLNKPPFYCVLHPQQTNDFINDLRGEQGAVAFEAASVEMLAARGPGFYGGWHGIEFWMSDQVPLVNAGADRGGAMMGAGAFGYKEASAAAMLRQDAGSAFAPVPEYSPAFIEIQRNPGTGITEALYNYYVGVVELEDDRGVEIITDA